MSRTYRRKKYGKGKGKRKYDEWLTHEWVKDESSARKITRRVYHFSEDFIDDYEIRSYIGYSYYFEPLPEKKRVIKINKFHSDNASLMLGPPKWFVRESCNRPFRSKERAEIIRMMKTGDYEDYNFDPNKNTAMWMWW